MINVLYTRISQPLPEDIYNYYLHQLPKNLQEVNKRFRRWQDRHANLFGKILLQEALQQHGFDISCLQYNSYDRPSISREIDFNISHSGDYVLCAIAEKIRLGIDIEQILPVEFENFKNVMTTTQWKEIYQSVNPLKTFFTYWTTKESVIKADSRGLSISLDQIHIDRERVLCEGVTWYIERFDIDPEYCVCLASNIPGAQCKWTLRHQSIYLEAHGICPEVSASNTTLKQKNQKRHKINN